MKWLISLYETLCRLLKSSSEETEPIVVPESREHKGWLLMNREAFWMWLQQERVSRQVSIIQNHHTWKPNYSHFKGNDHFERVISIERHHKQTRGWTAIGQHITVFPDGKIITGGRHLNTPPACATGINAKSVCIENVGNFDEGGDIMTEEQRKSIVFVTACLNVKFMLPATIETNVYHCWYAGKTCPGTAFFNGNTKTAAEVHFLPQVREQMSELNYNEFI